MNKVKVAGVTYDVVMKEDVRSDADDQCYGLCNFKDLSIELLNDLPEERHNQTLIHEIMHAVFEESGIQMEDDEDLVNRLALVWFQVLKDNDFSFLNEQEDGVEVVTYDGEGNEYAKQLIKKQRW